MQGRVGGLREGLVTSATIIVAAAGVTRVRICENKDPTASVGARLCVLRHGMGRHARVSNVVCSAGRVLVDGDWKGRWWEGGSGRERNGEGRKKYLAKRCWMYARPVGQVMGPLEGAAGGVADIINMAMSLPQMVCHRSHRCT